MRVIEAWGLEYRCAFTWYKPDADTEGTLPAVNSEIALYARRGKAKFVQGAELETAFRSENQHGRQKPDDFYERVAGATEGERLLMFAELAAEGFDHWTGVEEPQEVAAKEPEPASAEEPAEAASEASAGEQYEEREDSEETPLPKVEPAEEVEAEVVDQTSGADVEDDGGDGTEPQSAAPGAEGGLFGDLEQEKQPSGIYGD